jgi:hypothetical protein
MKHDWNEVDRMIELHHEVLLEILNVSQCLKRSELEHALKRFNTLHQGVLFDDVEDDDNHVQSIRSQAGGIKIMLVRVGRKHRNLINGDRTSDIFMKLIAKYKKAPVASPSPSPEPDTNSYKRTLFLQHLFNVLICFVSVSDVHLSLLWSILLPTRRCCSEVFVCVFNVILFRSMVSYTRRQCSFIFPLFVSLLLAGNTPAFTRALGWPCLLLLQHHHHQLVHH